MLNLPVTSPEHYLTGTSAMTIPSPDTSFVNWHFVDTFLSGKADFRVAGVNFPDTSTLLGRRGVHECAATLRRLGVELPADRPFYSANRDRAFLDLLVGNLIQERAPDHLRIEECCDTEEEMSHLRQEAEALLHRLPETRQVRHLEAWLAGQ